MSYKQRIQEIELADTENFLELVRISGLDPAVDFQHSDWSKISFANCNLAGFDFTGSKINGSDFKGARIAGAKFDDDQLMMAELWDAADFDKALKSSSESKRSPERPQAKAFFRACRRGNIKQIEKLALNGFDVNTVESRSGMNGLMIAAERGKIAVASKLLQLGADVDPERDRGHEPPLFLAVRHGHADIVRLLLEGGADIHSPHDEDRVTALMMASRFANAEIVDLLLDQGADPIDEPGPVHRNAVTIAAARGDKTILSRLLEKIGDRADYLDALQNALTAAARAGNDDVMRMLLDLGADITRETRGDNPLLAAVIAGRSKAVQFLLENGANPNRELSEVESKEVATSPINGLSFYASVMRTSPLDGIPEFQADFDPSIPPEERSILIAACEQGHREIAKALITFGAYVEGAVSPTSWTPLMFASFAGHTDVVELLLQTGANANARSPSGWTSLMTASQWGHAEIVKLLLQSKAEVDGTSDDQRLTALMLACRNANYAVAEILLSEKDIDINRADALGWTALHHLCSGSNESYTTDGGINTSRRSKDRVALLRLLLRQSQLDVGRRNSGGKSAYDVAVELNRRILATMLIN